MWLKNECGSWLSGMCTGPSVKRFGSKFEGAGLGV